MRRLVSVEEALALTLGTARLAGPEAVPLADAAGRTLAADVVCDAPQPPFDTTAMDGVAVRLADLPALPATVPLAGVVHAGDAPPAPLAPGTAVAVMTGAPVPPGTEAVVPVEWTSRDGDAVTVERAPAPGQHLRPRGEALAEGAVVAEAGVLVTPAHVGLLASVGAADVSVRRRPVVAVVATGDELVSAAQTPGPGQIRDANGPGLAAQVRAAGGAALGPFVARDHAASLDAALDAAAAADVVVVAGGVSMGERDRVRPALDRRGAGWLFWQVRQRPGKPLAVGVWGGRPVIGLPGNPVSAAVCFEVYVRPLLAAALGRPARPATVPAVLEAPVPVAPDLYTFARVTARRDADGTLRLAPAGAQGSHVALSLAASDGLAHLPPRTSTAAGAPVLFQPWAWPRAPAGPSSVPPSRPPR